MELIWKHKKLWGFLAVLTTAVVILFTIFGGAEEETFGMRGKVEAKRINLSFNMEYPIGKMLAKEGDFVHRGDVLGILQMDDLNSKAEAARVNIRHYEDELKDSTVDSEEKKLAYSRLKGLQADLLLKEKFLRQGRIVAPIDGVICSRLQNPGEMAVAMKPVYLLEIPDSKWVRAYADGNCVKKIKEGMPVQVMTELMPEMSVEGRITKVSKKGEQVPAQWFQLEGTNIGYEVKVSVSDPKNYLTVGSPVLVVVR